MRENRKQKWKEYSEITRLILLLKFMPEVVVLVPSGISIEFSEEFGFAGAGEFGTFAFIILDPR